MNKRHTYPCLSAVSKELCSNAHILHDGNKQGQIKVLSCYRSYKQFKIMGYIKGLFILMKLKLLNNQGHGHKSYIAFLLDSS